MLSKDFESEFIKNWVNATFLIFLSKDPYSTSKLYMLVRQLAKILGEDELREELALLWNGQGKSKIPVPNLELIVGRELTTPQFPLNKPFNYKNREVYTLPDMNGLLLSCQENMLDVFVDICLKYQIQIDMKSKGAFDFSGTEEELPKL